jgi:hypothetical protein
VEFLNKKPSTFCLESFLGSKRVWDPLQKFSWVWTSWFLHTKVFAKKVGLVIFSTISRFRFFTFFEKTMKQRASAKVSTWIWSVQERVIKFLARYRKRFQSSESFRPNFASKITFSSVISEITLRLARDRSWGPKMSSSSIWDQVVFLKKLTKIDKIYHN